MPARPGRSASCPVCGTPLVPKCGALVVWHWAHLSAGDCDPWAERDSEWHARWQSLVPAERREVCIGPHRADIVTPDGVVVELQSSGLPAGEVDERERFYDRMVWVVDCVEPFEADRLWLEDRGDYTTFRWRHPRSWVTLPRRPVLLDVGYGLVLYLRKIYPESPCRGWGKLITYDDMRAALNGQGRLPAQPAQVAHRPAPAFALGSHGPELRCQYLVGPATQCHLRAVWHVHARMLVESRLLSCDDHLADARAAIAGDTYTGWAVSEGSR